MHDVTHKCKHAAPTVAGRHSVFTGRIKKKNNNSMYIAKQQMFSPCSLSVVGRLQPTPPSTHGHKDVRLETDPQRAKSDSRTYADTHYTRPRPQYF